MNIARDTASACVIAVFVFCVSNNVTARTIQNKPVEECTKEAMSVVRENAPGAITAARERGSNLGAKSASNRKPTPIESTKIKFQGEPSPPTMINGKTGAFNKSNESTRARVASCDSRIAQSVDDAELSLNSDKRQAEATETIPAPATLDRPKEETNAKAESTTDEPMPERSIPAVQNSSAISELKEAVGDLYEANKELTRRLDEQEEKLTAYKSSNGFVINGPGGSCLKISGLLQTRLEMIQNSAPDGDNMSYGSYIRRIRLMFIGKLTEWLNFFVETDHPNVGLNGDWTGRMFVQDAYVEFSLHPSFLVDVGILLPSLSRHAMQGATSLLGMDYHGALIKYPTGSTFVWRDIGIQIRGLLFNDILEYRLAIFNGVHGSATDPRNPHDAPRLSGRLTLNVFDTEGGAGAAGMYYDGLYIKKSDIGVVSTKKVLSFGTSIDWQADLNVEIDAPPRSGDSPDSYTVADTSDYIAAAGDLFWDIPLGAHKLASLNGQIIFLYFNHGDRGPDTGLSYYTEIDDRLCYTGWGLIGEFGVRYSYVQPLFLFDVYRATRSENEIGDYLALAGGFNYYLRGHDTTLKLQIGADQKNGGDWAAAVKIQVQLVF